MTNVQPIKQRPNKDDNDYIVVTIKCPFCQKKHTHGLHKNDNNEHRGTPCGKSYYIIQ